MRYTIKLILIFLGVVIGIETFSTIPVGYIDKFLEFTVYILAGGVVWLFLKETI